MPKRRSPTRAARASTVWPTRAAAVDELRVVLNQPTLTVETMKDWLDQPACPLPRGRGPIDKLSMFKWLLMKRGPGRPADPASSATKDAQAAIWQAKAATLLGKMVKVEAVNDAVDAAVDELRRDLTETIPTAIAAMLGKRSPDEITDEARALGAAALNRFAEQAKSAAIA